MRRWFFFTVFVYTSIAGCGGAQVVTEDPEAARATMPERASAASSSPTASDRRIQTSRRASRLHRGGAAAYLRRGVA